MDTSKIIIKEEKIRIEDSYLVPKSEFGEAYEYVRKVHPDNPVILNRSDFSMNMEWATHNLCYNLGIRPTTPGTVDLEYPLEWYYKVAYPICGMIAWLFID